MEVQEISADCEIIVARCDTTQFTSTHQQEALLSQLNALADQSGKKVIFLDSCIQIEQLSDEELRKAGLVRADFGGAL